MATQGMVTVMKDGAVLMKVVAGCDGQNARLLARVIGAAKQVPDVRTAYRTALQVGFGDRTAWWWSPRTKCSRCARRNRECSTGARSTSRASARAGSMAQPTT